VFLWQQLQQKQKCVSLKSFQRDIEIDAVYAADRVAIIEILVCAGFVCAN
jgi:hypothetical protein